MEADLREQQAAELREFDGVLGDKPAESEEPDLQELIRLTESTTVAPDGPKTQQPEKGPKRHRQRERLARRAAKEQALRDEALAELKNQPDLRAEEMAAMDRKLASLGLEIHDIKPDGHCLFASILHQLDTSHNIRKSVGELRLAAADYIRKNEEDFLPFLMADDREVGEYTTELETTAMWGSDMEILALSRVLDLSTTVIQANSTVTINEEGSSPIHLGYFRHSYGLGEHYNSLLRTLEDAHGSSDSA